MYKFNSKIRYSEVDFNRDLSLCSLMDYYQDCSVFHSESIGLGMQYLKENHISWVLSSWQICIEKMPKLGEEVEIATWPYEMKGFYGYRNFTMNSKSGERLSYANSIWVMIDTESGRPVKISDELRDIYGMEPPIPMESNKRKIKLPDEYEQMKEFVVPASYIDTNRHMNNSKYVLIAQEYIPAGYEYKEVHVEYKKAAVKGDVIIPRVTCAEECVTVALMSVEGRAYSVVKFV